MPPVRETRTQRLLRYSPINAQLLRENTLDKFKDLYYGIKNYFTEWNNNSFEINEDFQQLQQWELRMPVVPGAFPDSTRQRYLRKKYVEKWKGHVMKNRKLEEICNSYCERKAISTQRKIFTRWLDAIDEAQRQRRIKRMKRVKFSANEEDLPPTGILKKYGRESFRDYQKFNCRFNEIPQVHEYHPISDNQIKYVTIVGEDNVELIEEVEETELEKYTRKYDKPRELTEIEKDAKWWEFKYLQFAKKRPIHRRALKQYRENEEPNERLLKALI
ncbi:1691_t:CDS:2 [Ambispora gerdemannii]|uniref:1691_t:CDS:1 n=1 Tax=Ambispora gerdemannii TaxID=144530 RepID=A0A9N9BBF5_9GLOM|nr:1691_t:CDS:2 [Ambispora gerdemannii]